MKAAVSYFDGRNEYSRCVEWIVEQMLAYLLLVQEDNVRNLTFACRNFAKRQSRIYLRTIAYCRSDSGILREQQRPKKIPVDTAFHANSFQT